MKKQKRIFARQQAKHLTEQQLAAIGAGQQAGECSGKTVSICDENRLDDSDWIG